MADELKEGDHVTWDTPQGKTEGVVEKKLTAPTDIKGHNVAASDDNPEYLDESQEVGQKSDGSSESTGHQSGRQIVDLLHKKRADYTSDDIAQMHRVVSYVHRHLAQKPDGDVSETHWRYSLMNWGHDPLKD